MRASLLLFIATAPILVGCSSVELKGDRADSAAPPRPDEWPFWAEEIKVHPFTSIDRTDGATVLVAHLTFLDSMGDPTKAVGRLRFTLRAAGRSGEIVHRWRVAIEDIEDNRDHYDPVTKTYVFGLKLERPLPEGRPMTMSVQLVDPRGQRIRTEAAVPVRDAEGGERTRGGAESAEGVAKRQTPAGGSEEGEEFDWIDLLTAPLDVFKPLTDLGEE